MTTVDDIHATHCCVRHGCKYGYRMCPVTTGRVAQAHPCMWCAEHERERAEWIKRLEEDGYTVIPPAS